MRVCEKVVAKAVEREDFCAGWKREKQEGFLSQDKKVEKYQEHIDHYVHTFGAVKGGV